MSAIPRRLLARRAAILWLTRAQVPYAPPQRASHAEVQIVNAAVRAHLGSAKP